MSAPMRALAIDDDGTLADAGPPHGARRPRRPLAPWLETENNSRGGPEDLPPRAVWPERGGTPDTSRGSAVGSKTTRPAFRAGRVKPLSSVSFSAMPANGSAATGDDER